jgi:hypothetical protein
LMFKGLYFPSTQDSGCCGSGVKDSLWGTVLSPGGFGLDVQ